MNTSEVAEADVFAIHAEAGQFCVEVFFFRTFQNWATGRSSRVRIARWSRAEVLGAFLAQFYDERPAPRLVLLSEVIEDRALLAEALSVRAGHKVEIATPQRGEKRELVEHALTNAKEAFGPSPERDREPGKAAREPSGPRSTCRSRRAGSMFSTTRISPARMPWAR